MRLDHLYELRDKEERYWWHVNKRRIVRQWLERFAPPPASVLEIGSGGGMLSSELAEAGWRVLAADIEEVAARFARGYGVRHTLVFDAGAPWPLASNCFDAVLVLDVLEHLEDEMTCLTEAHRVLRPGGVAILTAPAYPFLYAGWDRAVGHARRYSRSRIERIVAEADFQAAMITHWNVLSLPAALVLRGAGRLLRRNRKRAEFPVVPGVVNTVLKWWGRIECRCIAGAGIPLGLSWAVLVRKR